MTSPIDISSLLSPISANNPCGEDMLFSRQFDLIQEARLHDDPSLEQGEWVTDLKEADWPYVVAQSAKLLRESTKDLRLVVWFTEALGHSHGFRGLSDGYRLLSGLCRAYWDELHPLIEDGDMEMRIGNVTWLVTRSVELLHRTPIVSDGLATYSALTWETAIALEQNARRLPSQADELQRGKVTLENFDRIRRGTPANYLQRIHDELKACEESFAEFEEIFDECTRHEGPSFRPLKDATVEIRLIIERFAKENGVSLSNSAPAYVERTLNNSRIEPVFDSGSPLLDNAPLMAAGIGVTAITGIHNRAQAISQLKEVAAFFQKTEPSSPAAYMASKAARWALMPLHAWLRNVIKNEQELAQLVDLLDLPASDEKSS